MCYILLCKTEKNNVSGKSMQIKYALWKSRHIQHNQFLLGKLSEVTITLAAKSGSRRKTPRHIDNTSSAKIGTWSLVHGKRKKREARCYRGWWLGTAKSPGTTSEAKRRLFCLDKKGSFYLNSKRSTSWGHWTFDWKWLVQNRWTN